MGTLQAQGRVGDSSYHVGKNVLCREGVFFEKSWVSKNKPRSLRRKKGSSKQKWHTLPLRAEKKNGKSPGLRRANRSRRNAVVEGGGGH